MKYNFFICFLLFFLFGACSAGRKITLQPAAENILDNQIIIAEIGAKKIYLSDFQKMLKLNQVQYDQPVFFENENKTELNKAFDSFIMINTIVQLALAAKIDKTDTFLESINDFKQQLLVEMFDQRLFEQIVPPTEFELYEYYQKNKIQFAEPAKIALKNALADFDQLPQIKEVYEKLRAGVKFEEIFEDKNLRIKVSDLGFIEQGLLDESLEKYAFELDVNHFSDIIKSKFGYHILYCYQTIEPIPPDFNNELKEEIYHKIMQERYRAKLENILEDFKNKNKYVTYEEKLKILYQPPETNNE